MFSNLKISIVWAILQSSFQDLIYSGPENMWRLGKGQHVQPVGYLHFAFFAWNHMIVSKACCRESTLICMIIIRRSDLCFSLRSIFYVLCCNQICNNLLRIYLSQFIGKLVCRFKFIYIHMFIIVVINLYYFYKWNWEVFHTFKV